VSVAVARAVTRACAVALALLACPDATRADPDAIGLGREKYVQCASCHGADGRSTVIAQYPKIGGQSAPYVVIAHGAEVTGYGRMPVTRQLARGVLAHAAAIVAAGGYPAREAVGITGRAVPGVIIPPGVDVERFRPLDAEERRVARKQFGLDSERPLVLGLSRLVPRKGFDVVIDAVQSLPDVDLAIAGAGRDRKRLEQRARTNGRVFFLGRVPEADLAALYGCADVFAMCCHDRWFGLEAEGFGIVFLEAAACGIPSVAGRSGGAHEAVVDGETGLVVDAHAPRAVTAALASLCHDPELRHRMGKAGRERAVAEFDYERLAQRLAPVARGDESALTTLPR